MSTAWPAHWIGATALALIVLAVAGWILQHFLLSIAGRSAHDRNLADIRVGGTPLRPGACRRPFNRVGRDVTSTPFRGAAMKTCGDAWSKRVADTPRVVRATVDGLVLVGLGVGVLVGIAGWFSALPMTRRAWEWAEPGTSNESQT